MSRPINLKLDAGELHTLAEWADFYLKLPPEERRPQAVALARRILGVDVCHIGSLDLEK